MKQARMAVFLLTSCLVAPVALAKSDSLPEVTEEGLHRVPDSKLAVVYAEPGADLSSYDSVKIVDVYVAFKKNWERDHNRSASSLSTRVKPQDMERIKASLAEQFHDVFSEVLTEGGYAVTEETGENILLVRPAIIDLDPEAPDIRSATATRTYTRSAGEMSLYIELYDSLTGDLIAKALDRQIDRSNADFMTWSNRASNSAAAKRILKGWAEILRDALDEARQ